MIIKAVDYSKRFFLFEMSLFPDFGWALYLSVNENESMLCSTLCVVCCVLFVVCCVLCVVCCVLCVCVVCNVFFGGKKKTVPTMYQ